MVSTEHRQFVLHWTRTILNFITGISPSLMYFDLDATEYLATIYILMGPRYFFKLATVMLEYLSTGWVNGHIRITMSMIDQAVVLHGIVWPHEEMYVYND
jgi:hypothetical protein